MDEARDRFHNARQDMIEAFARMSALARRAGVDEDEITSIHGQFFDGNTATKEAFSVAVLLASVGGG